MTSPGGKLTALVCHPTKKVSKAEVLTYLSTNFSKKYIKWEVSYTEPFLSVSLPFNTFVIRKKYKSIHMALYFWGGFILKL